ncbi:MAG: hypothetical protein HY074_03520 [Deltaproteobacteria bacterium]|nr:hypothetical protein [Deltaproteobacteria bacterium]
MKIAAVFFGTVFLSVGCSSVPNVTAVQYRADPALITPYSFEMEKSRPFMAPYVATFSNREKKLFYVAAAHASADQYPDLLRHPTFLTIEKLFGSHPIDAVIVEGIAPWKGDIPKALLDHGDQCELSGYKINCGEPWFAVQLARRKGARILTGEPSEPEILNAVREYGFTAEDLLGFYVVRQIPQWKREGLFRRKTPKRAIDAQLQHDQKALGVSIKFGFAEFNGWHRTHVKRPRRFLDVDVNDAAPLSTPEASYVQRTSPRPVSILRYDGGSEN